MKRKSILKTLLALSMLGIFIDRCAPIIAAETLPYIYSPIKEEAPQAKRLREFKRDRDLNALEYMVLSHSISFNTISLENNCKGYALETFRTYKRLIAEDIRPDLEDKVRLTFGNVTVERRKGMHVWTEVNLDGGWQPYETTNYIDIIGNNQYLKYTTMTSDLTDGFSDYYPITTMQANQSLARINLRWTYSRPGGLMELYMTVHDLIKDSYLKANEFLNGEKKNGK